MCIFSVGYFVVTPPLLSSLRSVVHTVYYLFQGIKSILKSGFFFCPQKNVEVANVLSFLIVEVLLFSWNRKQIMLVL